MPVVQVAEQSSGEEGQMYRKGRLGRQGQIWKEPASQVKELELYSLGTGTQ